MKVKIENQITLYCFCLVAFVFTTCSDDIGVSSSEVVKSEIASRTADWEYIDFDSNRPFKHQTGVFRAASKRMDEYVKFENGKFVFADVSADELKVSKRVLAFMLSRMEEQNEMVGQISGLVMSDKNTLTLKIENELPFSVTSRNAGPVPTPIPEDTTQIGGGGNNEGPTPPGGGINSIELDVNWTETILSVYISQRTLNAYSSVAEAAAVVASLSTNPLISKAVAATCGLSAIAASQLAQNYKNGIVLEIIVPMPQNIWGCLSFSVKPQ